MSKNESEAGRGSDGGSSEPQPVFDSAVFRKDLILSGTLLALFLATYFTAAIITSAPLKDLAATMVLGLPVAAWVGWIAIGIGVVVTRIYLVKTRQP